MIINKVKTIVLPFLICVFVALALYPNMSLHSASYSTEGLELDFNVTNDLAILEGPQPDYSSTFSPQLGKSFQGFKEALAFKESRGNYFSVNTLGYLGKYQFGSETLKLIGIYNTRQFLANPELQEKAFMANASRNKWVLRKDIQRFSGKLIGGVEITESGILAAAHLAGPGSVKKYLRSYGVHNFADAYGATVKLYMKRFSGYDTSNITPNKKAKARV